MAVWLQVNSRVGGGWPTAYIGCTPALSVTYSAAAAAVAVLAAINVIPLPYLHSLGHFGRQS